MFEQSHKEWLQLTDASKRNIFGAVSTQLNLPASAIEKDWWVVRTLQMVFQTEIAAYTVFKGGTSLSKAWNLIERFSEDIDLALDKGFLGFSGELTKKQVNKLRSESCRYLSESYVHKLQKTFIESGFEDVKLQMVDVKSSDEDPVNIIVNYRSLTEKSEYITSRVLIEIGSRSLLEPFTPRSIQSFVGANFTEREFADKPVTIPTVIPERTFLEKIFLLHEEFQQPIDKIRTFRKSRHLYDLERLMDTEYAKNAMQDIELYRQLVKHRKDVTFIRGIDYNNHAPEKINPIPPDDILPEWKKDYEDMQQNMIYGKSLSFSELIERIRGVKHQINNLEQN
ncbi:MAG: nucleotidyltransferase [Ignavibacteriales bacterium]